MDVSAERQVVFPAIINDSTCTRECKEEEEEEEALENETYTYIYIGCMEEMK